MSQIDDLKAKTKTSALKTTKPQAVKKTKQKSKVSKRKNTKRKSTVKKIALKPCTRMHKRIKNHPSTQVLSRNESLDTMEVQAQFQPSVTDQLCSLEILNSSKDCSVISDDSVSFIPQKPHTEIHVAQDREATLEEMQTELSKLKRSYSYYLARKFAAYYLLEDVLKQELRQTDVYFKDLTDIELELHVLNGRKRDLISQRKSARALIIKNFDTWNNQSWELIKLKYPSLQKEDLTMLCENYKMNIHVDVKQCDQTHQPVEVRVSMPREIFDKLPNNITLISDNAHHVIQSTSIELDLLKNKIDILSLKIQNIKNVKSSTYKIESVADLLKRRAKSMRRKVIMCLDKMHFKTKTQTLDKTSHPRCKFIRSY